MNPVGTPFENLPTAVAANALFTTTVYLSLKNILPEPLNFCGKVYEGYIDHGISGVPYDDAFGCLAHLSIAGLAAYNGIAYLDII